MRLALGLGVAGAMVLAATTAPAAAAEGGALVPPPGYYKAAPGRPHGNIPVCPEVPKPYTGVLDFPSKYEGSGSSRDTYNAAADAEFKKRAEPITLMEKGTVDHVKKYLHNGQPAMLACALDGLAAWARAHALEGEGKTHTGRSERKWALASLSGSWLRLKFSSSAPLTGHEEQAKLIEAWLVRLAERVVREWPLSDPLEQINNHYYWSAWALVATGVATGHREFYDRGLALYRVFEKQVTADGLLPNEMARATRALSYHAYALQPLTMIAAFGKANGLDLAAEGDGALKRVAERVIAGADKPEEFGEAAGAEQVDEGKKSDWAWLEPYCWTVATCPEAFEARLAAGRPYGVTRMGGDLTTLFAAKAS